MEDVNYLKQGFFGRLLYKTKAFFVNYFGAIKHTSSIFRQSSASNKIGIVLAGFFTGIGHIAQKQFVKGLVLLLVELLFFSYFFTFGISNLQGKNNFDFLNLQIVAVFLIAIFVWIHITSFNSTLKNAQRINNNEQIAESGAIKFFRKNAKKLQEHFNSFSVVFKNNSSQRLPLILSFVFIGLPQILQKQIVKGILLLAVQVALIAYFATIGIRDLVGLFTLNVPNIKSDFNLVYGILAVFAIFAFALVYLASMKNVLYNATIISKKEKVDSFRVDVKKLLNARFYMTALAVPIIGAMAFTVIPLVFMILIAFTNYSAGLSGVIPTDTIHLSWIGFGAFKELLTLSENLKTFLRVLGWTLVWAVLATFTCYFGGIFLALLINKKVVKGKTFWRTMFIISMAVPQFVSLLIMKNMFDVYGPVNTLLSQAGLEKINFWGSTNSARILVILVNMWIGIPYTMVYSSGILQNIPKELYEAAYLEGSSKFHAFIKITMPYLLFMTGPIIITTIVSNINNFNVIFLLTKGAPFGVDLQYAGGTDILITWLYKLTMQNRLYNLGAAIGIIMFIISATLSLLVYRRTSSYKGEGDFA